MEALSDGVFAIAITLLVLELAVPVGAEEDMLGAVLAQWPSYLAYIVSFASIGAAWVAHTAITEYLDRVDGNFLRLNLLVLLVVSFLPFPTRLLGESLENESAVRVAATLYGVTLMATAALVAALWRYAVGAGLVRADSSDEDVRVLTERLTPGLVGYVVIIGVGVFWPVVAVLGYLVIALFVLVPVRLRR
jgi:uncharacterized membrane protein